MASYCIKTIQAELEISEGELVHKFMNIKRGFLGMTKEKRNKLVDMLYCPDKNSEIALLMFHVIEAATILEWVNSEDFLQKLE